MDSGDWPIVAMMLGFLAFVAFAVWTTEKWADSLADPHDDERTDTLREVEAALGAALSRQPNAAPHTYQRGYNNGLVDAIEAVRALESEEA